METSHNSNDSIPFARTKGFPEESMAGQFFRSRIAFGNNQQSQVQTGLDINRIAGGRSNLARTSDTDIKRGRRWQEFSSDRQPVGLGSAYPKLVSDSRPINTRQDRIRSSEEIDSQSVSDKITSLFLKQIRSSNLILPQFAMVCQHKIIADDTIGEIAASVDIAWNERSFKDVADIVFHTFKQQVQNTQRKDTDRRRMAMDLGKLSRQQLLDTNPYGVNLPTQPLRIGQNRDLNTKEEKLEIMANLIAQFKYRCIEKLQDYINKKHTASKLFERELTPAKPFEGFQPTKSRGIPDNKKTRFVLKRETPSNPAKLFGVDSSTVHPEIRDNYIPKAFTGFGEPQHFHRFNARY